MFLVEYRLQIGVTKHYAPSARAALGLVRDLDVTGGTIIAITRTRDKRPLTAEDLARLADDEIGPDDPRPPAWLTALKRLLDRRG